MESSSKRWEFGIMSSVWELQASTKFNACMAIVLYLGMNVPIAILNHGGGAIYPIKFLEAKKHEKMAKLNKAGIQEAHKTIKKLK